MSWRLGKLVHGKSNCGRFFPSLVTLFDDFVQIDEEDGSDIGVFKDD